MEGTARRPAAPVRKTGVAPRANPPPPFLAPRIRATLAVLGVLFSACSTGAPQPAPSPTAHRVQYRLESTWDDAIRAADGSGWEVTTDRGYRVHLTRGYLTSYSMELVECPKTGSPTPLAALDAVLWPLVAARAWAGHRSGTPNPAAIQPMQVESLTDPVARGVGTVVLQPERYCQLHYLIAKAGHDSPGLPTDLDMVDASIHLDGTYRAPATTSDVPFTVHTATANGALLDRTRDGGALRVDVGEASPRVIVRRHLGRMFDGVDFAAVTTRALAGRVLQSLVDHVDVTIEVLDADA